MSLNNVIAMQQEQSTKRMEWDPVNDAYPWVISNRFFPMALLTIGRPAPFDSVCRLIAGILEIDVETVKKIVLAEAAK